MLSHPLLADLIDSEFIPCLVNNRGDPGNTLGDNDATLELFGEPRLNNPVVRLVDSEGAAVAPRLEGQWTPGGVFRGVRAALARVGRPLPPWAEFLAPPAAVASAVFTMS